MADFPSKVTTETSSPNSRSSQPGGSSLRALAAGLATPLHSSFIRSIRAVLMMAEIVMVYHSAATVLYLSAFLANAASVQPWRFTYFYNHMPAAAFFGAVVTIAYGASAFFSYLDWKGDGGNAANTTVPT